MGKFKIVYLGDIYVSELSILGKCTVSGGKRKSIPLKLYSKNGGSLFSSP